MTYRALLAGLATAAATAVSACVDSGTPLRPTNTTAVGAASRLTCKLPLPDDQIPLPIAPVGKRVDLGTPTFSNPTNISNPLFPISHLSHVVLVGLKDGIPFRAETTLLPSTRTIDTGDRRVETLISQYVAYLDGRIEEAAIDWYAQADDGCARLDLFARRLVVDAQARDAEGAMSDIVVLSLILDRLEGTGGRRDDRGLRRIRHALNALATSVDGGDFDAVLRGTRRLQQSLPEQEGELD